MKENSKRLQKAGFTLIELMIVVVILGLLATIVMPRILGRPEQARRIKAKVDIRVQERYRAFPHHIRRS
ncbi:MAG: type IV pilin protein [Planctomycetota bacterium]|jgi:general secretion pathway protein G